MTRRRRTFLAAILTAGLCLSAVAWFTNKESSLRREELERETRVVAVQLSTRVRSALEKHRIALQQLATFFEQREEVTEKEFDAFAAATLKLTPLCLRLSALDPSLRVRWIYPVKENQHLVGFDVRTHPEGYEANLRAVQTRAVALSAPLQLVGNGQGFVLIAPAFRDDRFLGNVVCAVRSSDFFEAMSLPQVLERYEEVVSDSGITIFDSKPKERPNSSAPVVIEQFALGGRMWQIHVKLREDIFLAQLRWGQTAYWVLGSLLALAAGGVVGAFVHRATGIAARLQAQSVILEETKQRLDGTTQQLMQAEKLSALGELVAGVAHEINNPLSAILGYTQLALARNEVSEIKRRLHTVVSEAERAGRIVKNLLTFARKLPPEKKFLGLNGIIEKTLDLKVYHFRVNQIELEKDLSDDLPKTMVDFQQIQQVILNLLNNAEQAIMEEGRQGTIRVSTRRSGDCLDMCVADNGPGMPEDIQRRIFEPFFTTKKEGKGTGLGLSLCYGIIQEHGGRISVESEPGEGATFIVRLPILEDSAALAPGMPKVPAQNLAAKMKVFVVDDEPAVQGFLFDMLASEGFSVDTASDVPEALRKLATGDYDLIITDMKLPNGTGRDLYRAVAEKNPALAKRIIFTTGDGPSPETQAFVLEMGNEMLAKPFTVDALRSVIAAAVKS